ncbi:MAG: FecR family protein [Chitinophagaceae bacterium]|nr:MAG: FecR family protein [Chitinophagaceae bacterium]
MNSFEHYENEMGKEFRVAYLIAQFVQEDLTEEEESELDYWVQASEHNMQVFEDLTAGETVTAFMKWYYETEVEKNLRKVKARISFEAPVKKMRAGYYALAASLIGLIGFGIFYMSGGNPKPLMALNLKAPADITPGSSTAVLLMGDGRRVALESSTDTVIDANVHVTGGEVLYAANEGEPMQHRLEVPFKGFYKIVLPDGTRVWVNSNSSIQYPSRFTGNERRVLVTGETFFEVARDVSHPFIVQVNGIDVTAVGTAFNVNAYPDEPAIQTTLTEGKIRVQAGQQTMDLQPGQQLGIAGGQWSVRAVELAPVTAWTRNEFKFRKAPIESLMRMIGRWYGATVVYRKKPTDHFTGTIDRSVPVSQVLKVMEATGQVHFEIAGDTIYVND